MVLDFGQETSDYIPEAGEGVEYGYTYVGKITMLGYRTPPANVAKKFLDRGEAVPESMFVQAIQPLDFDFDTNPESPIFQTQGNQDVTWFKYRDKNGRIIFRNSPFVDVKESYANLGVNLRTNEDCRPLIGRIVRVMVSPKIYVPLTDEEREKLSPEDIRSEERRRGVWTSKVIEFLTEADIPPTKGKPRKRGYPREQESAATRVSPAQEFRDAPKLIEALNGKGTKDFLNALIEAGLEDPYVTEAVTQEGQKLVSRMTGLGMTWDGQTLRA